LTVSHARADYFLAADSSILRTVFFLAFVLMEYTPWPLFQVELPDVVSTSTREHRICYEQICYIAFGYPDWWLIGTSHKEKMKIFSQTESYISCYDPVVK